MKVSQSNFLLILVRITYLHRFKSAKHAFIREAPPILMISPISGLEESSFKASLKLE